jgi:hypothetical protein
MQTNDSLGLRFNLRDLHRNNLSATGITVDIGR